MSSADDVKGPQGAPASPTQTPIAGEDTPGKTPGAVGTAPDNASGDPRGAALLRTVRELEGHVAAGGWDGPVRLFALIRTAPALDRDPQLARLLPPEVVSAARADAEHLTPVEQEDLPDVKALGDLLATLAWPGTVDGAAVCVERLVLPPRAEADIPADPAAAAAYVQDHPDRRDVRMVAAVLRDGTRACAVRARDADSDDRVAVGSDLVPELVAALRATFED